MELEGFSGQLQSWLQECGAVKQLQAQMRKELFEILLQQRPQPGYRSADSSRASGRPSESEAALNLMVSEYLMQKGLWFSASVMISEADFIHDPPDIEVITTTKRANKSLQRHGSGTQVRRRQSPAKLADDVARKCIMAVLSCVTNADVEAIVGIYRNATNVALLEVICSRMQLTSEPQPQSDIQQQEELRSQLIETKAELKSLRDVKLHNAHLLNLLESRNEDILRLKAQLNQMGSAGKDTLQKNNLASALKENPSVANSNELLDFIGQTRHCVKQWSKISDEIDAEYKMLREPK